MTAAQIEAGYRDLIALAHARWIKVFGGTLTPFMGSNPTFGGLYGTTWIRTSHAFDAVIDFSRVTQSATDPLFLNPVYNSGDSLHPGDFGYEAMADAIPLNPLFKS